MAHLRQGKKYRFNWFRLVMLGLIGYFGYVLYGQYTELAAIRQEMAATRARLEEVRQQNKALQEERQRLTTPAYVEKLAREELGLVKPGEVPFIPAGRD
ncbi:Septum formation initiator [Thermosinus carboxydivorans Nor1]|uniref:Septum formation initiator n=1 Tax=Thermosinus carboxydivorans Nor1 TaxID=401526 RepID=A1HRS6_9FIRM|nr:septum formation initiator family protein [Thermosinus carboxydivorans]EAX47247.1 Septum formation initiator [Thermosinus carboxydivorans Nor1]